MSGKVINLSQHHIERIVRAAIGVLAEDATGWTFIVIAARPIGDGQKTEAYLDSSTTSGVTVRDILALVTEQIDGMDEDEDGNAAEENGR